MLKRPPFQIVEHMPFDQSIIEFDEEYRSIPIDDLGSRLTFWKLSLSKYHFLTKESAPLDAMRQGFEDFHPVTLRSLQLTSNIIFTRHYQSCKTFQDLIDNIKLENYIDGPWQSRLRFLEIIEVFRTALVNPAELPGIEPWEIMAWITGNKINNRYFYQS